MKTPAEMIDYTFDILKAFAITTCKINFSSGEKSVTYTSQFLPIFNGGKSSPPNDGWLAIIPYEHIVDPASLASMAIFVKHFHLLRCHENKFEKRRGVRMTFVFLLVVPLALVNLIIVLLYQNASGTLTVANISISPYDSYYACQSSNAVFGQVITYALFAVNGLIVLSSAVVTHHLGNEGLQTMDIFCKIAVLIVASASGIALLSPQATLAPTAMVIGAFFFLD
ncbi:hypothetical protein HDU84_009328 [Entophlyctis sp. JEL0112]|nr:hypothetical protein HDU84_009328 [Entophlyctis sp. JEL0112]